MGYDEEAPADTISYSVRYYCMICEEFFEISPIASSYCPYCWADPRYIIGPILAKEYDLEKMIARQRKKYKGKMNR